MPPKRILLNELEHTDTEEYENPDDVAPDVDSGVYRWRMDGYNPGRLSNGSLLITKNTLNIFVVTF